MFRVSMFTPLLRLVVVVSRFEKRQPSSGAKPIGPKTPDEQDLVTSSLIELDRIAADYERKWGTGRLVTICRDNARLSFRKGWASWREAAAKGNAQAMQGVLDGLKQLWRIADAQATADGHQPLTADVWEARLEDGRVLAIARTNAEAIAAQREGRATVALTMAEIARLWPKLEMLDAIKTEFPGATVERVIQNGEGFAESWVTADPLHELLHGVDVVDQTAMEVDEAGVAA